MDGKASGRRAKRTSLSNKRGRLLRYEIRNIIGTCGFCHSRLTDLSNSVFGNFAITALGFAQLLNKLNLLNTTGITNVIKSVVLFGLNFFPVLCPLF